MKQRSKVMPQVLERSHGSHVTPMRYPTPLLYLPLQRKNFKRISSVKSQSKIDRQISEANSKLHARGVRWTGRGGGGRGQGGGGEGGRGEGGEWDLFSQD